MRSLFAVAKNIQKMFMKYIRRTENILESSGEFLESSKMETKTVWKPHFFKYCQIRSIYFLVSKVFNKTLI